MTAPQPATPGSDSVRAQIAEVLGSHQQTRGMRVSMGWTCACGWRTDSMTSDQIVAHQSAALVPLVDTTEPPAETQQDDEDPSPSCRGGAHGLCVSGPRCGCPCHEPPDTSWATALAARPSADTETLREDPIEAVAVALWNAEHGFPWSQSITQDYYRSRARAALDAR